MGTIRDFFKTFSYQSSMIQNSNIMNGSGWAGNTAALGFSVNRGSTSRINNIMNSKYLSSYYMRMEELLDYEVSELSNAIVGIYKDYIMTYFSDAEDVITINDESDKDNEKKINKIFKQLDYTNECKSRLDDIIYFGGFCYKVDWDEVEKKYKKSNLLHPYNVIDVYKGNTLINRLVKSEEGKIYIVKPEAVVRMGMVSLRLLNDKNEELKRMGLGKTDGTSADDDDEGLDSVEFGKDKISTSKEYRAAKPLYYNIASKVKEFLLKDQIISLLGIKDLIQPLILTVSTDKNTPIDISNQFASNIENLINNTIDISSVLSSQGCLGTLIDQLDNNVRVISDSNSGVRNSEPIDLTRIYDKAEKIRQEMDASRESILTSVGIPYDLFVGRSTRFEAIKNSERLNSKINSLCKSIETGVKTTAAEFYKMLTQKEVSPDYFECNMFNKTTVEYNAVTNSAEIVGNMMRTIDDVVSTVSNVVRNNDVIDPTRSYDFLRNKLKSIDLDLAELITDDLIKKAADKVSKERESGGEGEENFGY